jgi:hypothetical protein
MDQEHSVFVQPDLAGIGTEMHLCAKIITDPRIARNSFHPAAFDHDRPFFLAGRFSAPHLLLTITLLYDFSFLWDQAPGMHLPPPSK